MGDHADRNPVTGWLLQLRWEVPADRLADFRGWYEEEHLGDMASVPGIRLARRFERQARFAFASATTWDHLTLYEVADEAVFDSAAYRALATSPSPRTRTTAAGLGMARTRYRQLFPTRGAHRAGGVDAADEQPAGRSVFHIMMGSEPGVEDDFNRWYNEEHLPLITGVLGVLHGRRFVAVEGAPDPDGAGALPYLALYELDDPAAAESGAMKTAGAPTPWRQRLGSRVRSHVQLYEQVDRRAGPR